MTLNLSGVYRGLDCISLLFSGLAIANTITCDVKDEMAPPSWPSNQIVVEHNDRQILTIDYVLKVPNDDGTFKDSVDRLYSRTMSNPSIRGGKEVIYCNPDDNKISQVTKNYYIFSRCILADSTDKILFRFSLKSDLGEGAFSILIPGQSGDKRSGEFASCI